MNERSMCWAQLQPRHCRSQRLWRAQHRRRAKSYDENLVDMAQLKSIRSLLSLLKRHKPSPPADPQFFQWAERVVRAHQKNGDALELVKVVSELVPFLPENQRKTLAQLVMTETKSEATTSSTPLQSEPKRFLDIDVGHARGHGHSSKAPLILSRSEMPTRSTPQRSGGRLWGMLAASPAVSATETSVESSALEMEAVEAEVEDMCLNTCTAKHDVDVTYVTLMSRNVTWSWMILQDYKHKGNCHGSVAGWLSMPSFFHSQHELYNVQVVSLSQEKAQATAELRQETSEACCHAALGWQQYYSLGVSFFIFIFWALMQQNMPRFHVSKSHGLFKTQERSSVSHAAVEDFRPSHLGIFDSRDLLTRSCRKCCAAPCNEWRPSDQANVSMRFKQGTAWPCANMK